MSGKRRSGTENTFQMRRISVVAPSNWKSTKSFRISTRPLSPIAAAAAAPRSRLRACKRWATKTSAPWPAASKHGKQQAYRRRNNAVEALAAASAFLGSAFDTNAATALASLTADGLVMAEAAFPHGARGG